jgi:hypothetical protein
VVNAAEISRNTVSSLVLPGNPEMRICLSGFIALHCIYDNQGNIVETPYPASESYSTEPLSLSSDCESEGRDESVSVLLSAGEVCVAILSYAAGSTLQWEVSPCGIVVK